MRKIYVFGKREKILYGYNWKIRDGLKNNDPKFDKYKDLVIPEEIDGVKVKEIAVFAFMNNELTSVIIPEGVTKIDDMAFEHNQLTSVIIPEGVTKIGNGAFDDNVEIITNESSSSMKM